MKRVTEIPKMLQPRSLCINSLFKIMVDQKGYMRTFGV